MLKISVRLSTIVLWITKKQTVFYEKGVPRDFKKRISQENTCLYLSIYLSIYLSTYIYTYLSKSLELFLKPLLINRNKNKCKVAQKFVTLKNSYFESLNQIISPNNSHCVFHQGYLNFVGSTKNILGIKLPWFSEQQSLRVLS